MAIIGVEWGCDTVADHVKADECLLKLAAAGQWPLALRCWEAHSMGVVMGYGNRPEREVNLARCAQDGIPVIRRCSGGGAVVVGPGCVCYTLVGSSRVMPSWGSIGGVTAWVMGQLREMLHQRWGLSVSIQGTSDLVWQDRKISGNAQRRLRDHVLFHGTLLCGFDVSMIEAYLLHPTREPDYRNGRSHGSFVANLPLPVAAVKQALIEWFDATLPCPVRWPLPVGDAMA